MVTRFRLTESSSVRKSGQGIFYFLPKSKRRKGDVLFGVLLKKATLSEACEVWEMQKHAFRALYEKYQDEGSPYLEPLAKIEARICHPNGIYYRIWWDGQAAGAVYLSLRGPERFRLGPLFVIPEFQNNGIAQAAIQALEAFHGAGIWELDTLLQEPGNCHLYEKMGYMRTGRQTVVNDRLTLIDYQKNVN